MKTSKIDSHQIQTWHDIERVILAFELSYKKNGGADPKNFAPSPDDPLYLPVVQELIRVDLELAWEHGEQKFLEEYRSSFPILFSSPDTLKEIAFEEYRLRIHHGYHVKPDEYIQRFQIDVSGWSNLDESPDCQLGEEYQTDLVSQVPLVLPSEFLSQATIVAPIKSASREQPFRYPKVGENLLGFKIIRELGKGAFAQVYLAEQPELADRLVVLKIAPQFSNESENLARLQHTNIVPIYSVHQFSEGQVVCMPYFGSTTLATILKQIQKRTNHSLSGADIVSTLNQNRSQKTYTNDHSSSYISGDNPSIIPEPVHSRLLVTLENKSPIEVVIWLGIQLANGLDHAHQRGIIHRDLKPANILIADDGTPMLLDFNLSIQKQSPDIQLIGGTPYYMSPEQLQTLKETFDTKGSYRVDQRSDIYSLGLILYELLVGQICFVSLDRPQIERIRILIEERSKRLPSIRELNPKVSPALEAIIAKCLEPRPEDRYQYAYQLREDLERQLINLPLKHLREPSLKERFQKFTRRNTWIKSYIILFTTSLILLSFVGIVIQQTLQQRDAYRLAVAEGDFLNSYQELRFSLTSLDRNRLELAIQDAKKTLHRYSLPGGNSQREQPVIPLSTFPSPVLKNYLCDLYLLLAAAEKQLSPSDSTTRSEEWLKLAYAYSESSQRKQIINEFHRLLLNPKEKLNIPVDDEGQEALLVFAARERPRDLLDRLKQVPTPQMKTIHWVAKANANVLLGEHTQAVSSYSTALAMNGKPNAELFVARGCSYLALNEPKSALEDFNAALEIVPNHPVILLDRALAYRDLKKYSESISDLNHVIELWPSHTRSYLIRSELYALQGEHQLAQKDREKALTTETQDPVSLLARGAAYLRMGQSQKALKDFDAVLKNEPKSREAKLNKAAILADELGELDSAVAILTELIEDHPECVEAIAGRGVYRARLKLRELAHQDAQLALQISAKPFIRYQVAGIYALTSNQNSDDSIIAIHLLASSLQDRIGLQYIDRDPDLQNLQKHPKFLKLIQAAKQLQELQQFSPK